jgi:hypothetical protein
MIRIINGERRYKDPTRCIEEVWSPGYPQQCSRKRGHGPDGLHCKQHAKKHNMEAQ